MKDKTNRTNKRGAALLVVLFIIMAVTVLSLGFLSRSDVELSCGNNMSLRMQMDYLAESALEHARGLLLNPQDVNTTSAGYWAGAAGQQLYSGTDYYDVNVVQCAASYGPTYRCSYDISSEAYREKDGEKIGRSILNAQLRLDPCITYWVGASTTISSKIRIYGDVYCSSSGSLINNGIIDGDVFIVGDSIGGSGSITGRKIVSVSAPPVELPGLVPANFSSWYSIDSTSYSVQNIAPNTYSSANFPSSPGNPAGVYYCSGDIELAGNVTIDGTLAVDGNMVISGPGNNIISKKNFPAVLINGKILLGDGGGLSVEGLVQVNERVLIDANSTNIDVDIVGGLFITNGGIEFGASTSGNIEITAAPQRASIHTKTSLGDEVIWSPASGAFFKKIARN